MKEDIMSVKPSRSKTKKRILMLNYEFPPLGGGGGVAAKKLAEGFVQLGYGVDYVTTWFNGLKEFETINGVDVHRVKVIGRKELPTATISSLISFPYMAYKKCAELCSQNKYLFINTHFAIPTGPLGVKLSKRFGIKNILSIHGGDIYDPTKNSSPHRKWYLRKVVKNVLNNSDIVVAQSSNTKENAGKYYQPSKEIKIIPLPYEPFKFKKITRKKLNLQKDNFYVIGTGRLVKRKGFDFLIKSLAQTRGKNIHALIIGDGPEKENLMKIASLQGVLDRVHFLGAVNDNTKFQYLQNSDVYVLSSVHEGFGIVLQEAMQVGLPIISTDNGGQVDFVKEGKNGFLIKFGDEKALADRINRLVDKPQLKGKFSRVNKNEIKDFKTEKICKKYLELA